MAGRDESRLIRLCLLALLCFAVAWMAVLPPYEGMDEAGHYASMRAIVALHRIPLPGQSFLPQEVLDYAASALMPYDPASAAVAPRGQFGGMSYPGFFKAPAAVAAYGERYRAVVSHPPYIPSSVDNWEAQHPPLYYLLLAPVMRATDFLPFVTQFFVLRLVSFLLALAGLAIGLRASLARPDMMPRRWIIGATLLYPLLVPGFIAEFARLGNDSLCLLLAGLLWACMLRWLEDEADTIRALKLGAVFGLGLLTKALFLPLLAGFVAFLLYRLKDAGLRRQRVEMLKAFLLPVILAGVWYVYKLKAFGAVSGSLDEAYLAQHGGLWRNLAAHFTWAGFGRGWLITLFTFFWGGTASQVGFMRWLALPFVLMFALLAGFYLTALRRGRVAEALRIPLWLFGGIFAGLLYFQLVCAALNETDRTPGWYLNIMLPFVAPVLAVGLEALWRQRALRLLGVAAALYGAGTFVCNLWAAMALYAGCATPGEGLRYVFASHPACLDHAGMVMERLSVLGWPRLSLAAGAAGFACIGVALTGRFSARSPAS